MEGSSQRSLLDPWVAGGTAAPPGSPGPAPNGQPNQSGASHGPTEEPKPTPGLCGSPRGAESPLAGSPIFTREPRPRAARRGHAVSLCAPTPSPRPLSWVSTGEWVGRQAPHPSLLPTLTVQSGLALTPCAWQGGSPAWLVLGREGWPNPRKCLPSSCTSRGTPRALESREEGQAGPGQSQEEDPGPGARPACPTPQGPRPHSHPAHGHWHQDPALGAACLRVG